MELSNLQQIKVQTPSSKLDLWNSKHHHGLRVKSLNTQNSTFSAPLRIIGNEISLCAALAISKTPAL